MMNAVGLMRATSLPWFMNDGLVTCEAFPLCRQFQT